ncbi:MAG TPA: WD40 repeat domain-containing protein, partial [Polyangium sp.]|nr:WD40 repeat domain-containing protein [Polyangium sp.]
QEEIEAKDAQMRAERTRFRQRLGIVTSIMLVATGLAGWAIIERLAANREKENANQQTEEARRQRDAAMVAEKKAEQASRMAVTRELMLTGKPDLAALVLQTIDDPQSARGWTQAAIDALKVRLPKITLQFARDEYPLAWSHDGTRVLALNETIDLRIVHANRQTPPLRLVANGATFDRAAFWSPDDRYVAVNSVDDRLFVWRTDIEEKPKVFVVDKKVILDVAWSPDSKRIAAGTSDGAVQIWNADGSGTPIIQRYNGLIMGISWNPAGTQIMTTVSGNGTFVRNASEAGEPGGGLADTIGESVWSPDGLHIAGLNTDLSASLADRHVFLVIGQSQTAQINPPIDIGKGLPAMVAWSPDGRQLAAAIGQEGRIVRANGSGETIDLKGHTDRVINIAWSPNGTRIATGSIDKTVRIWNPSGRNPGMVLAGHTDSLMASLAWSPDGSQVMTKGNDTVARVWDVTGPAQPVILEQNARIIAGSFSPSGKQILLTDQDGTASVWNVDGSGKAFDLQRSAEKVLSAAWSPDGQTIRVFVEKAVDNQRPEIRDRQNPRRLLLQRDGARIEPPIDSRVANAQLTILQSCKADGSGSPHVDATFVEKVRNISWSPDGLRVAFESGTSTLQIIQMDKNYVATSFEIANPGTAIALWSPDGKRIAKTFQDDSIRIWNADGSGSPSDLEGNSYNIMASAWSPDSRRFATTTGQNLGYIWNLDTAAKPLELKGNNHATDRIAWSPDGSRVATLAVDGMLRVWKAQGDDKPLALHVRGFGIMQWSPDGQRILTASSDNTIRIWDLQGRADPLVLAGHERDVTNAFWSPDGKRITTISEDRTARIWLVDIRLLQEALRNSSTNCLTPEQRESLLGENAENAQKGYETCEKSYGRNP